MAWVSAALATCVSAGERTCEPEVPDLKPAQQQAAAAFDAALAAKHLRPVKLELRWQETKDPYPGSVNAQNPPPREVGVVFKRGDADWLAGPTSVGGTVEPWEFADDDAGNVWRVIRRPKVARREAHVLCGCGDPGRGTRAMPMQLEFELPKGKSYRGTVEISYAVEKEISLSWTNRMPGTNQPCPRAP